jgi:methylenetetrahydrofolate dehydrogenase (NADP+) / methenyltetrahydrofolate cyclohydrolase
MPLQKPAFDRIGRWQANAAARRLVGWRSFHGKERRVATIIDGKQVAASVIEAVKSFAAALEKDGGTRVGLAVVIVGDDPASHTYVGAKSRMAKQCGFNSIQHTLPAETSQAELAALVARLNEDPSIHGILVQLPLPRHLNSDAIIQSIRPDKDVDGLHVVNAGKLATGDLESGLVSCTPAGAMLFVRATHGDDLSGLNAVVIGRSNLFGKPMAQLLLNANATVTTAHSRTKDLPAVCRNADILVAAVGRPEMVKADWVKPGATVIDVGINRIAAPERGEGRTRLVGDVSFAESAKVASVITPVPGGVGPMTIAMLMANTVIAAYRAAGRTPPKF